MSDERLSYKIMQDDSIPRDNPLKRIAEFMERYPDYRIIVVRLVADEVIKSINLNERFTVRIDAEGYRNK